MRKPIVTEILLLWIIIIRLADHDAYESADCEDKAWKELDAEELAFQEAVSREDERQAASQDHWDAEQERDLG